MSQARTDDPDGGQPALLPQVARARARAARERAEAAATGPSPDEPASELPVARVLVDVGLAHLDRPFDYLVPARMHESVVPGSRVKVRFAGQDVDGFVLERVGTSDHAGRLAPLRRSVSAEPVLSPAVARLCGLVATRYAGTRSDVLRLAVPPRHATTERRPAGTPAAPDPDLPTPRSGDQHGDAPADTGWARHGGGPDLLRA
ncbi:MAG: primosome assembly protein PriA, partial [Nocardioidaceae bacterium]